MPTPTRRKKRPPRTTARMRKLRDQCKTAARRFRRRAKCARDGKPTGGTFAVRVAAAKKRLARVWRDAGARTDARGVFRAAGFLHPHRSPEVLQALADWSPVATDMFDVQRFLRIGVRDSVLGRELDRQALDYLPLLPLAQHAWSALYHADPQLRQPPTDGDPKQLPDWLAEHHRVMEAVLEHEEYQRLHRITAWNPVATLAALQGLLPVLLSILNDRKQEEGQDGQQGDDPTGGGLEVPGETPGGATPPLHEQHKQMLTEALQRAEEDANKQDAAMRACGCEPPRHGELDPTAYLPLLEALNQASVRRMMEEVGRLGRIAFAESKRPVRGFAGRGTRHSLGDELDLVPGWRLVDLCVPALRRQFLLDLCAGELPQVTEIDNAPPGRGPVVLCVDESGSMAGAELRIAKALAVASVRVARKHGRAAWCISFSSKSEVHDTERPQEYARFMRSNMGGGTCFRSPLRAARQLIERHPRARQADILFLTDGQADLGSSFIEDFRAWQRRTGARLFVVAVGGGADARALAPLATSITHVENLQRPAEAFRTFWRHMADAPVAAIEEEEGNE